MHITKKTVTETVFDGALAALMDAATDIGALRGPALFLGARWHPACAALPQDTAFWQPFKPYADILSAHNKICTDDPAAQGYKTVLCLLPKNASEAKGMLARAARDAADGGVILAAAGNKAGGTRIEKYARGFGLTITATHSRHHARVVCATKHAGSIDLNSITQAIAAAARQPVLDGAFTSMPGIFGWDKIDAGSALLTRHIPRNISGNGADFGCGYGYLARHVLQNTNAVSSLLCIDADARALAACKENLSPFDNVSYLWADLTAPQTDVKNLDWIVMNPPFHEGREADHSIGQSIIRTAAASLKPGGRLWMVANARLPYEKTLKTHFARAECLEQKQGFKVFHALR